MYVGNNLTFSAGIRNRLFTGNMLNAVPLYAELTGNDKGLLDLNWNIADKTSFLLNTSLDRLNFTWRSGKFQATAGRQRINWGQTLVWNPNDIFNVWSFFDFDYTERPGSDALRLEYFVTPEATAEFAFKTDRDFNITTAAMYRFNISGIDLQFLAGVEGGDNVLGGFG